MIIADFVEQFFVPEHIAHKELAGRIHYRAILKHVLTPEEVNRVFDSKPGNSHIRLKAVSDWPYIGGMRLCDTRPEDVQRLTSAALARGYSTQTVKHIRNVVGAMFAHAARKPWFTGPNPATSVVLPQTVHREGHALTLSQVQIVLASMRYPEKEMSLLATLTDLNISEICGLRWKSVNLGAEAIHGEHGIIPARSIAIRRQIVAGRPVNGLRTRRDRNVQIPDALFPILAGLSKRGRFNGPDDFVLAARSGTAPNGKSIAARRLKQIGERLGMPWLSWQALRRTHLALSVQLGTSLIGDHVIGKNDKAFRNSSH